MPGNIDPKSPGCLTLAGILVAAAVAIGALTLGGDDADSDATDTGATDSGSPSPTDEAGETTDPNATFKPPSESSLPAGRHLVKGSSGGPIGCITCDGQFRYLSLEGPGVAVGPEGMAAKQTTWDRDTIVLEFGANASGPNQGRYGISLFVNGKDYVAGCALEIGSTSCRLEFPEAEFYTGDTGVIQIGEGGTMTEDGKVADEGRFSIQWWFVYEDDR